MNIRQMVIDYELDQMSRYLDLVQESLQRNHDHLEARFVEMTGEVTNSASECVGSSSDDYEDEFFEATQDFPQLLRLSFIVIWYAFVEKNLLDLCEELNLTVSVGAKENDNLDKGIRRARKFLVRAKNYEIDADHWQELIEINRLRNHIVHDGKRLRYSYLKPDGQFVRYENIMTSNVGLGYFDSRLGGDFENDRTSNAAQSAGRDWRRENLAVFDDENIVRRAFGHVPFVI